MDHSIKQIKVLLIDDDEDDYLIIRNLLSKIPDGLFKPQWCGDYDDAKQLITENTADVYMVDYRLGAQNGLELLEDINPKTRPEPFIILTGVGDGKVEQRAMAAGAADYLIKGSFDAQLLSRTLRYAFQRKQLEEQRVQELVAINRAKDEFISVASHQLRTPATGVKQYIGMVLEGYAGDINEAQQDMLSKAYESNERQLQIVSNLLRVAQVDAGKVQLRTSNVNLTQLIDDILIEQLSKFQLRDQKSVFEKPKEPIMVHIDKTNFRMVLENIIDNASKYSEEGKTVTVSLKTKDNKTIIEIQDQGVGIKADDQDRLFEKFFRIDNPLSTLVGGTGLGLYWAKKIVDLHDGEIDVTSVEGKGTTFHITLPMLTS
jgi:two-component system, sensor histidine kinase and response regulator